MPKPLLQVDKFLESQGIIITDIDPETKAMTVEDSQGEGQFDMEGFLAHHKIDPTQINVALNSPTTAVAHSPLSAGDRAMLAAGNTKGSLEFLRENYQDVGYDPDKGLSVLNQGVWQQVDPSGLGKGDAWERAAELGKDVAEFLPSFAAKSAAISAGASAGGAAGLAAPVPGGAAIGTVLGAGAGAFVAESAESAIGKLVGTYEATPEEFLVDTALESVLTAGLYAVPMGVRPTWGKTKEAFGNLAKNANQNVKNGMKELMSRTTGTKQASTDRLFENPKAIMGYVDKHIGKGVSTTKAEAEIAKSATTQTGKLFQGARTALYKKFGTAERQLKDTLPSNFRADVRPTVNQLAADLQEFGLIGKLRSKGGKLKSIDALNPKDVRAALGAEVSIFGQAQVVKGVNELTRIANNALKRNGAATTDEVLAMRRAIDRLAFNSSVFRNAEAQGFLGPMAMNARSSLANTFQRASPKAGQAYDRMNAIYRDNIDDVVRAERAILNRSTGRIDRITSQNFTRKLTDPVQYAEEAGLVQRIGTLQGKKGTDLAEGILNAEAARDFVKVWPRMGFLQGTALASGGAIAMGAPISAVAPVAGAALLASSPRMLGTVARRFAGNPYAKAAAPRIRVMSKFLQGMPVDQRRRLIQDPAFAETLYLMLQDIETDQQKADAVIQQAVGGQ
jgi:hypothetical protein